MEKIKMTKCKNDCPYNRYKGCCAECPERKECEKPCDMKPQECTDSIFEGSELEVFQNSARAIIQRISLLVKQKKEIEESEKEMREKLQQAMEKNGIKSFDNDVIKVVYVEPLQRTSIDSAKLKSQMPDVYAKFAKTSNVKAFVKIELKEDSEK